MNRGPGIEAHESMGTLVPMSPWILSILTGRTKVLECKDTTATVGNVSRVGSMFVHMEQSREEKLTACVFDGGLGMGFHPFTLGIWFLQH